MLLVHNPSDCFTTLLGMMCATQLLENGALWIDLDAYMADEMLWLKSLSHNKPLYAHLSEQLLGTSRSHVPMDVQLAWIGNLLSLKVFFSSASGAVSPVAHKLLSSQIQTAASAVASLNLRITRYIFLCDVCALKLFPTEKLCNGILSLTLSLFLSAGSLHLYCI